MSETFETVAQQEQQAQRARDDLVRSLAALRVKLTPAHIVGEIGQSARAAVAPLIDPLVAKTKSSGGTILLAASAAAVVFSLGRASSSQESTVSNNFASDTDVSRTYRKAASVSGSTVSPKRLVKTVMLSAVGILAGSALGAAVPLTDREKSFGRSQGRDLRNWAQQFMQEHGGEMVQGAVNAFGVASRMGSLLGLAAMVASHYTQKPASSETMPPMGSTGS